MASEEDKDKEAKRKKAESNDGGKMEIPIPPYLVTADIFCDSNFDGSVPPQLLSFFELTLAVLQRLLQNIETQLISFIRSKGAGAQAVALCQDFSRAMTARIAWSAYLQAIRTARKSSHQWIAAQALPSLLALCICQTAWCQTLPRQDLIEIPFTMISPRSLGYNLQP